MKIIDLLNKIANDEDVPLKIKINGVIFEYQGDDYLFKEKDRKEYWLFGDGYTNKCEWLDSFLKTKVEILEKEKKIPEKLENEKKFYAYTRYEENKDEIDKVLYILKAINLTEEKIDNLNNSVNEIIDFLKSKEEKEIPEKLEYEESDENGEFSINGVTFDFEQKIQIIKTVNEIIEYLKSKGE